MRARGKADFLLRYGFLRRGLPLGVLAAVALEGAFGGAFPETLWSPLFLIRLVACVAVLTASGCVTANFQWSVHERRFASRA